MSAPAGLQPIVLRDAVLTVADDDFSSQVLGVSITPEVSWEWLDTENSVDGFPAYLGTRWLCTIGYAQDMRPGSLTRYLFEQAAAARTIVFTPQTGLEGPPITCEAMILPGPLGGQVVDGILTAVVTLPLFGEPVIGGA